MPNITPCLWFDNQAEDAMRFYASVFRNSRTSRVMRYGPNSPRPEGSVLLVEFELEGQPFKALNGGTPQPPSPAISFFVSCETQAEIDDLWAKLSDGGETLRCGWVQDRFGVCWQIVPSAMSGMLSNADPARSARVMQVMLGMTKLDLARLRHAYDNG